MQDQFDIVKGSGQDIHQLKHLKSEINETYEQIAHALQQADQPNRQQLENYQNILQPIVDEVNM